MAERSSVRRQFRNRGPRVLPISRISRRVHQLWQGDSSDSFHYYILSYLRTFDIKRSSLVENLFEDSKSVQERSRWTNNDERGMDHVQQGTIELLPSRRISFLLRRNSRRGLSSRGKNRLCDVYHAHVSNIKILCIVSYRFTFTIYFHLTLHS